ncbi:hypothetical protein NKH77_44295 [Streptomyces sp. M19]
MSELSRYDAGWLHVFDSANHGELLAATWDDLNIPARMSTYAVAGLPWIHRDNTGHRVAVDETARRLGTGIGFRSYPSWPTACARRSPPARAPAACCGTGTSSPSTSTSTSWSSS